MAKVNHSPSVDSLQHSCNNIRVNMAPALQRSSVGYTARRGTNRRMMSKILVVEDNDDVREMMAVALQLGGGYSVRTAANGAQALALLKSGYRPAVILADLMMPVMNGWELRTRLASD